MDIAELLAGPRRRPVTPGRAGRHEVLTQSLTIAGNAMVTVYHVGDGGIVTMLQADRDSYREDLAEILIDAALTADPAGTTTALVPIAFPLDRAAVTPVGAADMFRRFPEVSAITREVLAVHRSEVIDGELPGGTRPDRVWTREPSPRAAIALLDAWPGGPWHEGVAIVREASALLTRELPGLPSGVRLRVRDAHGHDLTVERRWDRLVGDGIDLPLFTLADTLGPMFLDGSPPPAPLPAGPVPGMLEMTYQTGDRGYAALPLLRPLDECTARLEKQILRHAGNWAVFAGRSGAIVQVRRDDENPVLWLETPDPAASVSRGRLVTMEEAVRMLTILAREDRSAVEELGGLETVRF